MFTYRLHLGLQKLGHLGPAKGIRSQDVHPEGTTPFDRSGKVL
jgi:hypothetical protein